MFTLANLLWRIYELRETTVVMFKWSGYIYGSDGFQKCSLVTANLREMNWKNTPFGQSD